MFNDYFYHGLLKKYIIVFGTLFNNIYIERENEDGTTGARFKVPVAYGPREKFLARLEGDPNLQKSEAITLPRMSFQITGMSYNPQRKLNTINNLGYKREDKAIVRTFGWVPYDISVQLVVMTKSIEDGNRIIEQILPYFTPDWTVSMKPLDDMPNISVDIPYVLNGVQPEDTYEADFVTRRALTWTLDFTIKAQLYGPVRDAKVIKVAFVNLHPSFNLDSDFDQIITRPGMTANGQPTTDPNLSIDPKLINVDDNWDYIITMEHIEK